MILNNYQKFKNIDEAGSMSNYNKVLEININYFIKEVTFSTILFYVIFVNNQLQKLFLLFLEI
jgi:hypothetical protein